MSQILCLPPPPLSQVFLNSTRMKAKGRAETHFSLDDADVFFQRTPTLFPVAEIDPSFSSAPVSVYTPQPFDPDESGPNISAQPSPSAYWFTRQPELILREISPDVNHAHSLGLPTIQDDLEGVDFREWKSWAANRRVAAIRRWVAHVAHQYGPTDRWAQRFDEDWARMKGGDEEAIQTWLHAVKQRVRMCWCALGYLERAMEGELPSSADDWRDLYAQALQLSKQLCAAVGGVEGRLDQALGEPLHKL